ncbi:hypothetical protein G3I72_17610 [Pseudomonas aeruginosa]|nr:hypothetical protein [Pseudomonas aeruginosa]
MYELIVHDDATADLRGILASNRRKGLKLVALIQQLQDDQDLLDRLTQSDYGAVPMRRVQEAQPSTPECGGLHKITE